MTATARKPVFPAPEHLRALARQDFGFFARGAMKELLPTVDILWNWHLDLIANRLEDVAAGRTRRLIINIPPRYGKSLLASVALPAYMLGHDPTAEIVCVSYARDLAEKMASDTRRLMNSPWYGGLFSSRLVNPRARLTELRTPEGGCRLATSVDGQLTGRGGNIIIVDDPLKPIEAVSDTQRQAVNNWFDSTATTRPNDKEKGAIIVIMQRLHEDDLVGHLLRQGHWEHLSLPALAEIDEVHEIRTPVGARRVIRAEGEPLHSARESRERIIEARDVMGSYAFSAQYQQRPAPLGGGLFRREWLGLYDPASPPRFNSVVQSWDTAYKADQVHDWSVCTTWGVEGYGPDSRLYLLDVHRERLEHPALLREVVARAERYRADHVLIEDCASGISLIQLLKAQRFWKAIPVKPRGDKVVRFVAATPFMEAGNVLVPPQASWLETWAHELAMFPNSAYKDQVDSTSQAINWITEIKPGFGILEYYRQEAERLRGWSSRMIEGKCGGGPGGRLMGVTDF
jgi:predicted phage terminase large subunit-like protein